VEGGRVTLHGSGFALDGPRLPDVTFADTTARAVFASPSMISVLVPTGLDGGRTAVRMADVPGETVLLDVGSPLATGLHQVDNPVFDGAGNLYVTYSGTRGQEVPVSIFRVSPTGRRESYVSGIVNPTSMTFDHSGQLYVSSRFEGTVYRVFANGTHEPYASDLGIACGLVFDRRGVLYVGDRSGTIFAVQPDRTVTAIATLPASVAAFHLAIGPDDCVYISGPTLGPYDHVYRLDPNSGVLDRLYSGFGRPQGIAFDSQGVLYVVEALAGWNGVYRLRTDGGGAELVVAGQSLVGIAISPNGGMAVASNDTVYSLAVPIRPLGESKN
jgi:sugar lactone lactonase YvrE